MGSLQRDPAEVREFIENIDPNSNGTISFEEFINLMQSIENKIVQNGQMENNNLNSNE
jgi:Ca2+-binding EF-hand superfamily protein